MNLKAFHIFFICCSLTVAIILALWGLQGYRSSGDANHLWLGVIAVVMIVVLAFYGYWFRQKMRRLPEAVLALTVLSVMFSPLLSRSVWACAVCFKDPNSELVKGAQSGVLFLGILVYALLMGILGIAFTWYRRAKALSA